MAKNHIKTKDCQKKEVGLIRPQKRTSKNFTKAPISTKPQQMPKIIVARCNASFCMRFTPPDKDFCRRRFKASGDYVRTLRKLSDGYDQALQDFKESSHTIHETKQRMES